MNTTLKQNLTVIANIDVDKAFSELKEMDFMINMLKGEQEEARKVITEFSSYSISKHPVKVVGSPCGNLYIKKFVTDYNEKVTQVITTVKFYEAEKVCANWADNNASNFKNGKGEPYKAVTEKQAALQAAKKIVNSYKLYLGDKANDLSKYLDVSLWSGDSEKVETKLI